jgi:hypothetical protein
MNPIAELFQKDIHRNINGVIKVGQLDEANIRQELEEYILTKELNRHFGTFFDRYSESLGTPTDKMGIWISGFFGSGKSHFLKILAYLLENRRLGGKNALDYFDTDRVPDAVLRANITKAARNPTDVILFNIDSKADSNSKNTKDAIVKVFQKVFDDHLGYFGTVPTIAEFERQLDKRGKYAEFKTVFERASGTPWVESRDAWAFCRDEIAIALQETLGVSEATATDSLDILERDYSLSVEKFARTVKEYLDGKGTHHRLLFLVDEVGQYIGEDSDLMLNLQTVVEDLGVHCGGRAWAIVTSQEAIDEITKNRIKGKDFSKIVGRFGRPLTLSSTNTDEVIKLRLLEKTAAARQGLSTLYQTKEAILRNQVNFTDCADLPGYRNEADFVATYPFIPYQFNLLQKVFTQIRLMGAAGKHLAEGERSLLDAFQIASKKVAGENLGALVPFHRFYLAVEGFLDSGIRRVIDQAAENSNLQPIDLDLLKTLFLIKYVKEIRANVNNLTTLGLSKIDEDRIKLKESIEASLKRLEKQTLIQRIGDEYSFLTHEEQDIGREIKNTELSPADIAPELQKLIFEDIFADKKFRYDKRHDYGYNRKLDDQTSGQQTHDIGVHVVTPYCDRYGELSEDSQCQLETTPGREVIVRLPDDPRLLDELDEHLRTTKYLHRKNSENLTPTARKILDERREENGRRRDRLQQILKDSLVRADVFACGSKVQVERGEPRKVLNDGLTYLIDNVYTKLQYINSAFESEDDIARAFSKDYQEQDIAGKVLNDAGRREMLTWLNDEAKAHRQVTVKALIDKFNGRPYGWAEFDTLGVMAGLVNQGKLEIRHSQSGVNPRESGFVTKLRSRKGLTEYTLRLGETIDPTSVKLARDLAGDLLSVPPATDPRKLYEDYRNDFSDQKRKLEGWQERIDQDKLPFTDLVQSSIALLHDLLTLDSPASFFQGFRERRRDLEAYGDDRQKLTSFFEGRQIALFLEAREELEKLEADLHHLDDADSADRLERVLAILCQKDPTRSIPELPLLLDPVKKKVAAQLTRYNEKLTDKARKVKEDMARYVTDHHATVADRLDLAGIQERVDRAIGSPDDIRHLDGAIAREAILDDLRSTLLQQIDRAAAALEKPPETTTANAAVPPAVKPMISLQVVDIAPKTVLETPEDVEEYIDALKRALLEKIESDYRVRIE